MLNILFKQPIGIDECLVAVNERWIFWSTNKTALILSCNQKCLWSLVFKTSSSTYMTKYSEECTQPT